ncbi:MAG: ATP-binding protein [Candidatus Dormibacteria bacterium]
MSHPNPDAVVPLPVPRHLDRSGQRHPPAPETTSRRPPRSLAVPPPPPGSLAEVGLPFSFVTDLVLKILHFNGNLLGREVARRAGLPWPVTAEALTFLSHENLCGTSGLRGSASAGREFAESLEYLLTAAGRERAREVLQVNQYAGPAPVPVDEYLESARELRAHPETVAADALAGALQDLVLPQEVRDVVGTALTAHQALFLYGPPGNGKSSIADACAGVLGSPIYIPHALYVHGEVIRLYDPVHHRPVSGPPARHDPRWTLVYRPVVRSGGELRDQQLEASFDRTLGFYEASLQLKANGGIFHVDDFGRQVISPREILNRLIVPLESGVDYLNIARAGTTVAVPYATLLLLSTNLDPSELVDEAFMRRVRYKVLVPDPEPADFRRIFERVCRARGVDYDPELVDHLVSTHYQPQGRALRGCQPRDLVDQALSTARYLGREPALTRDLIDRVARSYFADFRYAAGLTAGGRSPA